MMRSVSKATMILALAAIVLPVSQVFAQDVLAEASFSIPNVKYLDVEGGFCNIRLDGYSGSLLKMDGSIRGNGNADKYEIIYRQESDRIKVWVESPNSIWQNIEGSLNFEVPENVVVTARNSSGNIEAGSLKSQEIMLEATSGNVTAKEITGDLKLECTSGNITLYDQKGGVNARTTSGNLRIENVTGNLDARATSGNVQIYTLTGNLNAVCTSGNIRLREITGRLEVKTTSGNIRGEGIMLTDDSRFNATSGGITIGLLNEEDDLSYDLDAGSGNLYAAGSSADDRLMIKRGSILVSGVTSSGNQKYTTD